MLKELTKFKMSKNFKSQSLITYNGVQIEQRTILSNCFIVFQMIKKQKFLSFLLQENRVMFRTPRSGKNKSQGANMQENNINSTTNWFNAINVSEST